MSTSLQITFKDMDPSPAIETRIRQKASQLDRFFRRAGRCHVTVAAPHRRHRKGGLYEVTVRLTVPPGREIVTGREGRKDHAHEDVNVAIRDAFDAAIRQLEDHARRLRAELKTHAVPMHGRVASLFADHGFVATDAGDIYFHRNSVVGEDFDALEIGREVRLDIAEDESANGWQATTVRLVGKHHPVP